MRATAAPISNVGRRIMIFLGDITRHLCGDHLRCTWPAMLEHHPRPPACRRLDPVAAWQARIERRPDDAGAYAGLGLTLLQKVRESNDSRPLCPRTPGVRPSLGA